jgi:hypothetical protein
MPKTPKSGEFPCHSDKVMGPNFQKVGPHGKVMGEGMGAPRAPYPGDSGSDHQKDEKLEKRQKTIPDHESMFDRNDS